ncbi:hypothetical protein F3Y22_tig00014862pilonHSYRG00082 [Hibiscus syriacus]|uniref:Uncharacterized protein n=1 Tax=Hibiscus syriacus TaxID=106335 RepID=A0A6A3C2R4_HIBSY|nr:hypothetical protein F3Y22_tig00014862pilonHSYRG00082 [Hibiscus syriacus]
MLPFVLLESKVPMLPFVLLIHLHFFLLHPFIQGPFFSESSGYCTSNAGNVNGTSNNNNTATDYLPHSNVNNLLPCLPQNFSGQLHSVHKKAVKEASHQELGDKRLNPLRLSDSMNRFSLRTLVAFRFKRHWKRKPTATEEDAADEQQDMASHKLYTHEGELLPGWHILSSSKAMQIAYERAAAVTGTSFHSSASTIHSNYWRKPPSGYLKLNVDGACPLVHGSLAVSGAA